MTQPRQSTLNLSPALLDENSGRPLYAQIIIYFRERIISGEFETGLMLPTENELTELLGVSRITVKRALVELANSGFVQRRRGRGTIVTFNPSAPIISGSFETLIDGLTSIGLNTRVSLISSEICLANASVRMSLELSEKARVRRIIRTRHLDGQPFSHLLTHIPEDIASGFTRAELARDSLISLLGKAGHEPVGAEQTITAVLANESVAQELDVSIGAPVLRIHRVMRDRNRRPVQDIVACYRADRFQYHMTMARKAKNRWSGSA